MSDIAGNGVPSGDGILLLSCLVHIDLGCQLYPWGPHGVFHVFFQGCCSTIVFAKEFDKEPKLLISLAFPVLHCPLKSFYPLLIKLLTSLQIHVFCTLLPRSSFDGIKISMRVGKVFERFPRSIKIFRFCSSCESFLVKS